MKFKEDHLEPVGINKVKRNTSRDQAVKDFFKSEDVRN